MMQQTVLTGLSPNTNAKDACIASAYLFLPWKWLTLVSGSYKQKAKSFLEKRFYDKQVYLYDSGRSALYIALSALDISSGDEVLLQGYTCVVVTNAITRTGATPVYVDIDDTYNIDPDLVEQHITKKTKALIIQHTFGAPAKLSKLMQIAKRHNLIVIEDCAHSLGAKYNGKFIGSFGDLAMLSFGSDKAVSSVRGGALVVNNEKLVDPIEEMGKSLLKKYPRILLLQHLLHVPIFYLGRSLYHLGIGKVLLFFASRVGLVNKIIYPIEKSGGVHRAFPAALPNALAHLLYEQLLTLDTKDAHRRKIVELYQQSLGNLVTSLKIQEGSVYLRYPVEVQNREEVMQQSKKRGLYLGDWYTTIVAPADIDQSATQYKPGSCPRAELAAKHIVNLPTHTSITKKEVLRIVDCIKEYARS